MVRGSPLFETVTLFEQNDLADKVDKARVELAYCYFREGALDEARVVLQEALKRPGDNMELRALALLRLAMVEAAATRYNDSLKILMDATLLFEASDNHTVRGSYHNQLAHALQSLGTAQNRADYFDRAIVEFTAASYHFERSGHLRYNAHVENNLGLLLHSLGRCEEAHEHLDRAREIFMKLGDSVYAAQVDETRAQVMLSQGSVVEAEKIARQAAEIFERVNALRLLAEALTTRAKALARLERSSEARAEWERAALAAEQGGSVEAAGLAVLTMCEELGPSLSPQDLRHAYARADRVLVNSQSPEILARLRHVARQALSSFPDYEESDGYETKSINVKTDDPAKQLLQVENSIAIALSRFGKQVNFKPEALAAMSRFFLADGLLALSELIEQSVAAAPPGTVISADDVEIVAMRSRTPRGTFTQPWAEFSLNVELGCREKRFIELALKAAGGKISVAARLLGLQHNERLTSIIKSRYPELLAVRTPPIPRKRSIIRKPRR